MVSIIPSDTKEYFSCDTIAKGPDSHASYDMLYPIEFLNSISGNNFPPRQLILKKEISIMLLHNLNHSQGLCNGTRLIVTTLGDLIIEVEIMSGKHIGNRVLIPRICLTLKTPKIPFVSEQKQYPVSLLCDNNQQESRQTLSNVVVYLKKSGVHTWTVIHCFLVSNLKKGLKVLIEDENEKSSDETKTLFTGKYFPASLLHSNISVACSLGKDSV
jgi:ATP-dependent DNA helicase PIF1